MKAVAYILVIILCTLMVHPLFSNTAVEPDESCCSESKCDKPTPSEEKDDCGTGRCNPLMSCPTGNFYLLGSSYVFIPSEIQPKQKKILVDDNRISAKPADCWHPPEII